uniref:Uncharacterized protein n=1 Tax=Myotis myotis TaxID=51298 RepID=A0A7J7R978_MYOMY|nr:hypothetical protein mMyoMyo1_010866 [Myotis myotis]
MFLSLPLPSSLKSIKKYIKKNYFRETSICCSTYPCIHWWILAGALTGDQSHNLGTRSPHSNQLSYLARDWGHPSCSFQGAWLGREGSGWAWMELGPGFQTQSGILGGRQHSDMTPLSLSWRQINGSRPVGLPAPTPTFCGSTLLRYVTYNKLHPLK